MNIILTGKSCSGKTEIAKQLAENLRYEMAITVTTRPARFNEVNGVDYIFVSKREFLAMNNNNELRCVTEYNGEFYGVELKMIKKADNTVFILDPYGADTMSYLLDDCIKVLVYASPGVIARRQSLRGYSDDKITQKTLSDAITFDNCIYDYDIAVDNNGDINVAVIGILTRIADIATGV